MGLHPAERVREYTERGWWTGEMIDALLRERVAAHGNIPAIVDPLNRAAIMDGPARTLTWPELDDEVDRLAQVLLDLGVRAGDTVGYQLPNTVEVVTTFLAIVRLGAIAVPFPVQYRAYELTKLCNVAQVQVFVTASRIGQRLAAAEVAGLRGEIGSLRAVAAFGDGAGDAASGAAGAGGGVIGLDGLVAAAGDRAGLAEYLAGRTPDPNECVTICWTSGTESTPKGVQRTHYDWLAIATSTLESPELTADDVLLNPFPMTNMAGISGEFLPWLRVGGLLVQHHPFDLDTFLAQIERYRVTYTCAPPALLTTLLHNEELLARTDISSLRVLGSGSTPLAPSLLQGWSDRYGIEIINFFGSNEGISLLATPKDFPDPSVRAVFFPRLGAPGRSWSYSLAQMTRARLVDPDSRAEITAPGVAGELEIKGPALFPGYLPASGVADPFGPDGFLRTGDLLEIAGEGGEYLHFVDRSKDLISRGGVKISAAEVESLIAGHPAVAEVAVVGYPDERLGERSCAVVATRPGRTVTLGEITDYLRGLGIAVFKLPERLELRDALPRNPLGKVLKRELRDELRTPPPRG